MASSMRNVRERRLIKVELSLRVKRAAEIAATGPDVKAMTAACGTYATRNMNVVTPMLRVMVGASLEINGRQRSLCETK